MAYYFDILVDDEIVKLKLTPKCVYEEYYIDLSIDGEFVHQKIELTLGKSFDKEKSTIDAVNLHTWMFIEENLAHIVAVEETVRIRKYTQSTKLLRKIWIILLTEWTSGFII